MSRVVQWRTSVRHLDCLLAERGATFEAVFCLIENNVFNISVLAPPRSFITWLIRIAVQMSIKTGFKRREGVYMTT